MKYYDFNGDGIIDDADKTRLGKNSFPRANYGININLSYKGFSFSTLFQGATRFDKYLGAEIMLGGVYKTDQFHATSSRPTIGRRIILMHAIQG
ncbi:MAG: hypothetical protein LUE99_04240 [Bacteroides sp.]|nr:hypothetical protein [Bacteroides sp.]